MEEGNVKARFARTRAFPLAVCPEYLVIYIFTITRWQWFALSDFKRSSAIAVSFSPQEKRIFHFFLIKTMCKFI